jgi:hypothetical protein
MESTSPVTELANSLFVLDVLWLAETTEKVSPEKVQQCYHKAKFSTSNMSEK